MGYNSGRYNNGGYNNGGYNNGGYNNGGYKKKSGCKYKAEAKNNKPAITGWNISQKRGFISFVACPVSDGQVYTSKQGNEFTRWVAKVKFNDQMREELISCLYSHKSNKLIFTDWNMVANPSAPNGGYFGTNKR